MPSNMLAKVLSGALVGLEGELVEVEVDLLPGLPAFNVVGLPDAMVQEARERVRSAVRNSGCYFPTRRITVNLAPADIRKEGSSYDLPIAVGIAIASEQVVADVSESLFLGELSLDGQLRSTHGILPMVSLARERGLKQVFVPAPDAAEASLVDGLEIYAVPSLHSLLEHLRGERPIGPYASDGRSFAEAPAVYEGTDFADVRGQEHVKRGLEVAAAGGHNLLMVGPAGAGKTLLARALPSVLPSMAPDEALMVTRIYSVAGLLPRDTPLIANRPFRAPHHTISTAGLVGGGRQPRPGEISLAHRGVLFLDELPEFGQQTLEVLRQPLEDHLVTISRAHGSVTFPANFMLVAAMNPCPCGNYGDPVKPCVCSESVVSRYQRRISGPLLDRIDIFVEVPRVEYEKLSAMAPGEPSKVVRERVDRARARQNQRFEGAPTQCNAEMTPAEVRDHCQTRLDEASRSLLKLATDQLSLSARAFHRILKVARTIADLAECEAIAAAHVAEAIQYRQRSRAV
jgi:magnesium chelatase family protein